jgi:hypothetical protein
MKQRKVWYHMDYTTTGGRWLQTICFHAHQGAKYWAIQLGAPL